jgi:hypothetical protein
LNRLTQINALLSTGPPPSEAKGSPSPQVAVAENVASERTRLLADVTKARAAAEAGKNAPNPVKARMLARAEAPTWPIEPDRKAILLWGVLIALVAGAGAGAGTRAFASVTASSGLSSFPPPSSSRTTSSHPPDGRYSSAPGARRARTRRVRRAPIRPLARPVPALTC